MRTLRKPRPLKKGDTIGLFAPAGPLKDPEVLWRGQALLESCGFHVRFATTILETTPYLAGSDERRCQEFVSLWHDPEVTALLAVRGGYGSLRILPLLLQQELGKRNKAVIGFSDLTILLNGLNRLNNLVTFHGPMLSTLVRDHQDLPPDFSLYMEDRDEIAAGQWETLRRGKASGQLLGGNLTSLMSLIGTPYEPDWNGAILILEDIHEPAYKIDRMLTQLKLSGRLNQLAGLILGEFHTTVDQEIEHIETIFDRVLELTPPTLPVWCRFPAGHGRRNIPFPIGVAAVMDDSRKVLRLTESCF